MRLTPFFFLLAACAPATGSAPSPAAAAEPTPAPVVSEAPMPAPQKQIAIYDVRVKAAFPHRTTAFTQGLFFHDGELYESTGQRGESEIAKLSLPDGHAEATVDLPDEIFGEGATVLNGKIYSLSWQARTGFIHDVKTLKRLGTFSYEGQGWGLTTDGTHLIMSDGSNMLRYLKPDTFEEIQRVPISLQGQPVGFINELEWINNEIWANVWQDEAAIRVDPWSGEVKGLIDLSGLYPANQRNDRNDDVPNGIAYDPTTDRIIVTGKRWPQMFEIELVERQ